jgi:hypothetical protein
MANTALALLESALREKKLDCTLTTVPSRHLDSGASIAVDVPVLDACLQGGLPKGHLSEIAGRPSSGRTTVLLQLLSAITRRGEIAALVDTFDRFDVTSAVAARIDLDRLLWIRGHDIFSPVQSEASTFFERTIDRGLKALNLVLQAGGFSIAALDLADVPPAMLARIPFTTWLRVQRTIEGSETACVLIVPRPLARSAGGLTLSIDGRTTWSGDSDRSRCLAGLSMDVRVISPRRQGEKAALMAVAAGLAY